MLPLITMLAVLAAPATLTLRLGPCSELSARWSWDGSTHAVSPRTNKGAGDSAASAGCLTAADGVHSTDGGALSLRPCNRSDPHQRWVRGEGTVLLAPPAGGDAAPAAATFGWVSEKDTRPGERVWLYDLSGAQAPSKNTYCEAHHNCAFVYDAAGGLFKNPAGSCAVMGTEPSPPPPSPPPPMGPAMPTCARGSPAEHERFCDVALTFEDRAAALVRNLTLPEKLELWTVNTMARSIPRLNVKGFRWDSTCIHGGPFVGATVGPHAINQGATFDAELVEAMSNATADEMRAHSILSYAASGGQTIGSLSCDGGPLANSAHDPRWGRISETYVLCAMP